MSEKHIPSATITDSYLRLDPPLVSVVMPAYNAENHIARSLRSILAQTYRNFEIIVVDDGSSDDTEGVVRATAPDAVYVRINNSGPAAARNEGNTHASGKYLAFLDADDLWHPRKLELQVEYLERHPDINAVYCMWCVMFPGDTDIDWNEKQVFDEPLGQSIISEESGWLYPELLLDAIIHTSSVIILKSTFDQLDGFNQSLNVGEDYDLWIRLSRITEIHKLRATLSAYNQRIDSITSTPQPVPFGATVILRNLKLWGRRGPDGRTASWYAVRRTIAQSYRRHGAMHLRHGNSAIAIRSFLSGIFYDPVLLTNWKGLIKTFITHRRLHSLTRASGSVDR